MAQGIHVELRSLPPSRDDDALVELTRLADAGSVSISSWRNGLVAVSWTQDGASRSAEGYRLGTALSRALRASRALSGASA